MQLLRKSGRPPRRPLQSALSGHGQPTGGVHPDQEAALGVAERRLQWRSAGELARSASWLAHLLVIKEHSLLCCHRLYPHTHTLTFRPHRCPALRSGYEEEEADLPKLEDLQGAAKGLMRLQDVYALQVGSLAKGRFQRVADGKPTDVCLPTVSMQLSGDDCFLVGKVHKLF